VPFASAFADLIHYFAHPDIITSESPIFTSNKDIDFRNLWYDLREVADDIHKGLLKYKTLEHIKDFVSDGHILSQVLSKIIKSGKKIFLLTNSPWFYTDGVMSWMLNHKNPSYDYWIDYFNVVIVDAQKPNFFLIQKEFREIERTTNVPKLGKIHQLQKGHVYCNGNLEALEKLCGITAGNSVLYIGDHIFSDVMISKKKHAWRTLLIIPELSHELDITEQSKKQFEEIMQIYTGLQLMTVRTDNNNSDRKNENIQMDIRESKKQLKCCFEKWDSNFNRYFGSRLRCKLQQSFFAMQVSRYADLYTTSVVNLLNYSMEQRFFPIHTPLPHEKQILS